MLIRQNKYKIEKKHKDTLGKIILNSGQQVFVVNSTIHELNE